MKLLTVASMLTGLALITLIVRKQKPEPVVLPPEPEDRYDIDEFITDQAL